MDDNFHDSKTLNISADLNLSSINFPKFPKNVTVPDELNDHLRGLLDQVKLENRTLQQQLSEKDLQLEQGQLQIHKLSQKLSEYGGCNNEFTTASQLANSKIVELTKRLREKNAEIEVCKTKCSKLEASLRDLQTISEELKLNEPTITNPASDNDKSKRVQEKLTYVTNKWMEEKNQNSQLKNDLKKANKWLQQEVGDKFETLLALNNSNSNWRGRAQIICDLQQKNAELKEKLKKYSQSQVVDLSAKKCEHSKHDKKLDELSKENEEIKNNCADMKRKYAALKARCKVVETEYAMLRVKHSSITEHLEESQITIAQLTSKVLRFNDIKKEDLAEKDHLIRHLQQENQTLKIELDREKCLSENKSKELLERKDDIILLNKRIRSSRPPSSYAQKEPNTETKMVTRLEAERLRLIELLEVQNTRLNEERNSNSKLQQVLRAERQKGAKLEANFARLQLEQAGSLRSSYSSRLSTPKEPEFNLADKLELAEENIKLLATRLETEIHEKKHDLHEFSKILQNFHRD